MEDKLSEIMNHFKGWTPLFEWFITSVSQHPFEWVIIAMLLIGTDFVTRLWKGIQGLIAILVLMGLFAGLGRLIEWLFPGLMSWLFSGGLGTVFWYFGVTIIAVVAIAIVAVMILAFFSDDKSDTEEPTNTITLEKE